MSSGSVGVIVIVRILVGGQDTVERCRHVYATRYDSRLQNWIARSRGDEEEDEKQEKT